MRFRGGPTRHVRGLGPPSTPECPPMDSSTLQLQTLLELDARHDELLDRLDELDRRVAQALTEGLAGRNALRALDGKPATESDGAAN